MNDLISKAKALKAIEAAARLCVADANHNYLMGFQDAAEAVGQVEPEGKEGEWLMIDERTAQCSNCGMYEHTKGIDMTMTGAIFKAIKHYCPNCGAYMGEKGEE